MSSGMAKLVAISGIILMGIIALLPTGGASLGQAVTVGSMSLDPLIGAVVVGGSVAVFSKKKNK